MTAESGNEAYAVFQKHSFDAVISDMGMPKGSGRDLLLKIRSHDSHKPLFYFHSSDVGLTVAEITSFHVQAVFRKPCETKEIVNTLKEALFIRPERFDLEDYVEILPDIDTEFKINEAVGDCEIINVSDEGMCLFIEGLDSPAIGQAIDVKMQIEGDQTSSMSIEGSGEVRWVGKKDGNGFEMGVKLKSVEQEEEWTEFVDSMKIVKQGIS